MPLVICRCEPRRDRSPHRLVDPRRFLYPFAPMGRVSKPRRKPSRDQIRVWLSTVLSPMLRALDIELQFVERRNWSFRCDSQDFEYLCPTPMMVAMPHHANAEQVFRYYPSLRPKAASHDRALAALRDACRVAYESLTHSPRFQALPMPADARPEDRKYFAEYMINGLRDLLSHYSFADFWKAHGGEYLELRSEPSLAPSFEVLEQHGSSFRREVVGLRRSVKEVQEHSADEAGLPPVDPSLG